MLIRTTIVLLGLLCATSQTLSAQRRTLGVPRRTPAERIIVPPARLASRPATTTALADSVRLAEAVARTVRLSREASRTTATRRDDDAPVDRMLTLVSFLGSRYDNNVNRDRDPVASVGVVSGLGMRLQSGGRRPWFEGEYDAAWHRYSATDRFNRVSQRLRLTTSARLARAVEVAMVSEGSLKGSAEDRDVADQLALLPRVDVRLSERHRLRLVGAHRWRRYALAPDQDATNEYAALELRRRSGDEATWEGEARVERNAAAGSRFVYQRMTVSAAHSRPVGRRSFLDLELRYRVQRYPHRLVELDDVDVPRRDARVEPAIGWRWSRWGTEVELRYEPERRWSNDPDKGFVQHLATMGISRRW